METSSRRTRKEGQALVCRFRESGLTQRKFAKREGIKVCTLQYWLKKPAVLEESGGARFVELKPGTSVGGGHVSLSVHIGADITMRFAALPPPSYLGALSRELVTC